MKKIITILILGGLLTILVVPTIVLAEPACPICQTPSFQCSCGTAVLPQGGGRYCADTNSGFHYPSVNECLAHSGGTTATGSTSVTTPEGVINLIERIYGYIFLALLSLAGIFLVVAGYYFVTASGNSEKVTKGREILINALIGVAIAVAAKGLITLVRNLVS
ncbi:MAG: hypothetical protein ABIB55_01870 [Candidatus Nealsonbacteria bacterium]